MPASFWVMLTDFINYAQVGWYKQEDYSREYVWSQYSYNNGSNWTNKFYNPSTGEWQSTPHTQPPSVKEYVVTWSANSSAKQIRMQYDGGTTQNITVSWTPTAWQSYAEILNYGTPNEGTHVPGDTSNKVRSSDIEYRHNGSWTNATVSPTTEGHGAVLSVANGFKVWDTRCSS